MPAARHPPADGLLAITRPGRASGGLGPQGGGLLEGARRGGRRQAAEIFREAHTIVLLPWFYDRHALDVFGKGDAYLNHGLISAEVLALIEREGCADLLINAAARGALVDRAALGRAVADGWLRYYSDELPSPGDPLLGLPEARFTGHVGGSCAQPQAAVGRNTHRILRQLVPRLAAGGELQRGDRP